MPILTDDALETNVSVIDEVCHTRVEPRADCAPPRARVELDEVSRVADHALYARRRQRGDERFGEPVGAAHQQPLPAAPVRESRDRCSDAVDEPPALSAFAAPAAPRRPGLRRRLMGKRLDAFKRSGHEPGHLR